MKTIIRTLAKSYVKTYLKALSKEDRPLRRVFVGRRLIIKQYNWLHFTKHPWDNI